jgi:hypothetical protein
MITSRKNRKENIPERTNLVLSLWHDTDRTENGWIWGNTHRQQDDLMILTKIMRGIHRQMDIHERIHRQTDRQTER